MSIRLRLKGWTVSTWISGGGCVRARKDTPVSQRKPSGVASLCGVRGAPTIQDGDHAMRKSYIRVTAPAGTQVGVRTPDASLPRTTVVGRMSERRSGAGSLHLLQ